MKAPIEMSLQITQSYGQQLLARRRKAAVLVVDPHEPRACDVLLVGDHRQAFDVLVLLQGVADPAILRAAGPFHVDHLELAIGLGQLERDAVVLLGHFPRQRRRGQHQLAIFRVGFDDQFERLRSAVERDRQRGERRQRGPIFGRYLQDDPLARIADAPNDAADRCLDARIDARRHDQLVDGDVADDLVAADGKDMNRHLQPAEIGGDLCQAVGVVHCAVGEDDDAPRQFAREARGQLLQRRGQPAGVVGRAELRQIGGGGELLAEAKELHLRTVIARQTAVGVLNRLLGMRRAACRLFEGHAPRGIDQELHLRRLRGQAMLRTANRVQQHEQQQAQHEQPRHEQQPTPQPVGDRRPSPDDDEQRRSPAASARYSQPE